MSRHRRKRAYRRRRARARFYLWRELPALLLGVRDVGGAWDPDAPSDREAS